MTSKIASHLLARSALYPGLSAIVTDIVSGGEGSELYRITLPDEYIGLSIDEVSARLRNDHSATLLSVNRGGRAFVNPPTDFVLQDGDDAIVVAQGLGLARAAAGCTTSTPCRGPLLWCRAPRLSPGAAVGAAPHDAPACIGCMHCRWRSRIGLIRARRCV